MLPGYDLCCWSLGSRGSRVKEASTACENDKITTLKDSSFLISPKPDEKKITIIITECSLKQTLGIKSTFFFFWCEFSWVEWLGDQTKEIKKDEGHVRLPSKIFQSYDTTIILTWNSQSSYQQVREREKAGFSICHLPASGRDSDWGDWRNQESK